MSIFKQKFFGRKIGRKERADFVVEYEEIARMQQEYLDKMMRMNEEFKKALNH